MYDLHLPITPRPCADTNSQYLQALTDSGREFCRHEFEHHAYAPASSTAGASSSETGRRRLRSALDTPPAELMHALGRQANVGHHQNILFHQAVDGRCYMAAPLELDDWPPPVAEIVVIGRA